MKKKLDTGTIITSPVEALKKYEKEFFDYLRKNNKGYMIAAYKKHLGGEISFEDIGDMEIDGDIVFNDMRQQQLESTLDEKKNQTYYALLVDGYGQ